MKNNKNKPFTVTPENMAEVSLKINPLNSYKVNVDKIKTIKDIKLILKRLDLNYRASSKEDFEEIKHLLIID